MKRSMKLVACLLSLVMIVSFAYAEDEPFSVIIFEQYPDNGFECSPTHSYMFVGLQYMPTEDIDLSDTDRLYAEVRFTINDKQWVYTPIAMPEYESILSAWIQYDLEWVFKLPNLILDEAHRSGLVVSVTFADNMIEYKPDASIQIYKDFGDSEQAQAKAQAEAETHLQVILESEEAAVTEEAETESVTDTMDPLSFGGYTWTVVRREGEQALVICDSVIGEQPFNLGFGPAEWKTSTLKEWLDEFYATYASDEASRVVGTDEGMVFPLAIEDAKLLTEQVLNVGAAWWLSDIGSSPTYIAYVDAQCSIMDKGTKAGSSGIWVRPAMWITMSD